MISEPDPCCPVCNGYGEVRHPRWGSSSCPAPTMPCPRCQPHEPQWQVPR